MQDDPLWVDVTELMKKGMAGLGDFVMRLGGNPAHGAKVGDYVSGTLAGSTALAAALPSPCWSWSGKSKPAACPKSAYPSQAFPSPLV